MSRFGGRIEDADLPGVLVEPFDGEARLEDPERIERQHSRHGEQVERPITLSQPASSGLTGTLRNHRFRASGFTRHYETFAELMQMIALLALGLARTTGTWALVCT